MMWFHVFPIFSIVMKLYVCWFYSIPWVEKPLISTSYISFKALCDPVSEITEKYVPEIRGKTAWHVNKGPQTPNSSTVHYLSNLSTWLRFCSFSLFLRNPMTPYTVSFTSANGYTHKTWNGPIMKIRRHGIASVFWLIMCICSYSS